MSYEMVALDELCKFINGDRGKNYPSKGSFKVDGIPFISAGNLKNFILDKASLNFISQQQYDKLSGGKIEKDDIVFCLRGSLGKFAYINEEITGAIASSLVIIRPKDKLNVKYLYFFLRSNLCKNEIANFENGAAQPNLSGRDLKKFKIPLPPLSTQKKIVDILDRAQALIDQRKEQIAEMDKLVQALFYDMFGDPVSNPKGWEVKSLSYFGDWKSGGTPSRSNEDFFKGQIPWISSGELNETYITETTEHITEDAVNNSATKLIDKGALLLGMYDTAALKSSITMKPMTCNQAIAFSKLNESHCNLKFIYWYIQIGKTHFRRMQRGVRQKNMNLTMIKELPVFNPPVDLQNNFADYVKKIEVQKETMTTSLNELESHFNVLMQQAFNGELV